jgi:hypothetical protein
MSTKIAEYLYENLCAEEDKIIIVKLDIRFMKLVETKPDAGQYVIDYYDKEDNESIFSRLSATLSGFCT